MTFLPGKSPYSSFLIRSDYALEIFGGIANSRKYAPKKFGGGIHVLVMPPKNTYFLPNLVLCPQKT